MANRDHSDIRVSNLARRRLFSLAPGFVYAVAAIPVEGQNETASGSPRDARALLHLAATKEAAADVTISPSVLIIETLGYAAPGKGGARYSRIAVPAATSLEPRASVRAQNGDIFEIVPSDVDSTTFGAVGDGRVDDTAALQALIDYCCLKGIPAIFRPGHFRHTGLELRSATRVVGAGRAATILLNSGDRDSLWFNRDFSTFAEEWSITGLTIRGAVSTGSSLPRRALSIETCRHGQVSDLRIDGHLVGIWERSSWSTSFDKIRIENCTQAWQCAAGQNTGGVPSQRRSVEIDSCKRGIGIEKNGVECVLFSGGSIEGCQEWAVRISGRENRAITFEGYNFENNCIGSVEPEFICGDPIERGTGPSTVTLIGCRFMNRSRISARLAIALNEGSGFSLLSCQFLGYAAVATLGPHFGSFTLSSNKGATAFVAASDGFCAISLEGQRAGLRRDFKLKK